MRPSEIADLFDSNPGAPFRLTLCGGDVVLMDNPDRTLIDSLALYVGKSEDPASRLANRVRMISIPNIAMIERIDPRRLNGRWRRPR